MVRIRVVVLALALGAAIGLALRAAPGAEAAPWPSKGIKVLELYTSQGCSSCPPADALLERYASRDDVIALTLPVDYWDRLGWKDTFASPVFTARQRAHARSRGDGEVYTPQLVINGRAHAVGHAAAQIDDAVAQTSAAFEASRVGVALAVAGDALVVDVGRARSGGAASGTVLLGVVQSSGTVAIGRGENSGRTVTYHNVVRALKPIGTWTGAATQIRIPRGEAIKACCQAVVVLLQQDNGPLLGAAKLVVAGK